MDTNIESILLESIENMEELINIEKIIYGDNYIEINTKNEFLETPLILAAKCNRANIVELILENNNTNVNLQDIYGDTALHIAVRKGYSDIAKILLNDWRTNINIENKNGEYIIHLVAGRGDIELYGLLETFRDLDITVRDILGYTPIMYAFLKLHKNISGCINSSNIISNLLDKGAIVEIPDILVDIGEVWKSFINHPKFLINSLINKNDNLFSYSCRVNDLELLKVLTSNHNFAPVSYLENLETAIEKNNIQICLELLEYYHSNPEPKYLCDTLFRYILYDEDLNILLDSLLKDSRINITTISINSIIYNRNDVLWNYEIDINTTDENNNTLLHLAIINNSSTANIKKLIRLGVNPNFTNKYALKALDYAIDTKNSEYINILIPVTIILDSHKLRLIDIYKRLKPELLIDIIVDIDFNNNIDTDTYKNLVEFTGTLSQINKKKTVIGLLGSTTRYLEHLVGYKNISISDSHNTEDILTLESLDISNKLNIIQYGTAICGKYKTITLEALVGLVKNHKGEYMYEMLDPFDRSNISSSKVYPTGNPVLLELIIRGLIATECFNTSK
jgi:ankyrin repeat protein